MRRLLYGLLFLGALLLFLYLNFPFERFIDATLCKKGVEAREVLFKRFPPEVILKEVKVKELPFKLDCVEVKPVSPKEFFYAAELCGGKVKGFFTYPLNYLNFNAEGIRIERCTKSNIKVYGELSFKGNLSFKGKDLEGGEGELSLKSLKVGKIKFGLFSFNLLNLGNFKGRYEVKRRNSIDINGEGKGRDADYKVKGKINYNPKVPQDSYLNLKVQVKVKREPFKGKEFDFTVRGSLENLRVW
ncbi:hypothetical protein [Thermovibrio sp.]